MTPAPRWSTLRSLRLRLLLATLVAATLALVLAGLGLSSLFRDHVQLQFQASLALQLDQLMARFALDAQGHPTVDAQAMLDPRWQRPLSGLYWQVDEVSAQGQRHVAVLRSRSLWDDNLLPGHDALPDGSLHVHQVRGPQGQVLLLERTVRAADPATAGVPSAQWRLMVAGDLQDTQAAIARFDRLLAGALLLLLVLLGAAAWAQVTVGLWPLQRLQHALRAVRLAQADRLEGQFPNEVQPLVDDFNRVLAHNHAVLERARTQAGNLAHALKTPLSVLDQLAASPGPAGTVPADVQAWRQQLGQQLHEQVQVARKHIDWHLARARVAATQRLPGQRTAVLPVVEGLVRVMRKVHAGRDLDIQVRCTVQGDAPLCFAGEEQDLQEMVGNLLDNACQWARHAVRVTLAYLPPDARQPSLQGAGDPHGCGAGWVQIAVEDDGPGIDAEHLDQVKARGARLDESVPGTGLGLAIVQELAVLYGGSLALQGRGAVGAPGTPLGGLQATLRLEAAGL